MRSRHSSEWRALTLQLALHLADRPKRYDHDWELRSSDLIAEVRLALAIEAAQKAPATGREKVPTVFDVVDIEPDLGPRLIERLCA